MADWTRIVGKIHVGPPNVYPWTVREGTKCEDRDVASIADRSQAFFARAKQEKKPIFLTVGLHDPHRERSRAGFCNGEWGPRVHDINVSPSDVEVPPWINDVREVRQELAEYYRAIYRCDQGVGMLMEALALEQMENNTLVIFMSDNGAPFVNAKTTMYDAGIKLPLIVRSPLGDANGLVNPNLVSWIDILPTMLDWGGIDTNLKVKPQSPVRTGRSILPILGSANVHSAWQPHVFGSHTFHSLQNYYPTRYIRGRRYKYVRNVAWRLEFPFAADLYCTQSWEGIRNLPGPIQIGPRPLRDYIFRPAEQLYDLEQDPNEVMNIAERPEVAQLMKDLRCKLEAWQEATADLWLIRDGQTIRGLKSWIPDLEMNILDRFDFDVDHPATKGTTVVSVNQLYTAGPGIALPVQTGGQK